MKKARLIPTGDCWCGCGAEVGLGRFFAPGHNTTSLKMVVKLIYGSEAKFLTDMGFGPHGKNLREEYEREGSDADCVHPGRQADG